MENPCAFWWFPNADPRRWIVFGSMDIDGRIAVLMSGDYSLPSLIIGGSGLDASPDYIRVETSYTCVYLYMCVFHIHRYMHICCCFCIYTCDNLCVGHIHALRTHCASSFSNSELLFLQESWKWVIWLCQDKFFFLSLLEKGWLTIRTVD